MKYFLIFLTSFLFLCPIVFAANPPTLIEPATDSITVDTSPKLSWQYSDTCPSGNGSCFLIEVDNNDDFSSPEKLTYTNNLNYSPSLSNGKWFWRVKAKDDTGSWSEYSEVRSFTIDPTQGITQPTPQPTSYPSATPDPVLDIFAIADTPSSTDSNASFSVSVQITKLQSNTTYYIKGAFYKEGSSNYFGKTLVNGNWIKNSTSSISQSKITSDSSGSWVGSLEVMPDSDDSGFSGSGQYSFKVAKYDSAGGNLTWSNIVSLNINYIPEPTPVSTTKPSPTPKVTSQPSVKSSVLSAATSSSQSFFPETATVAGIFAFSSPESSPSAESSILGDQKSSLNLWLIGGGVLFLITSSSFLIKFTSLQSKFLWLKDKIIPNIN